jgi:preprotein translocase subunit SecG
MNIYQWTTVVTAVIVSILILLQTRGASLGAGMGGGGEVNTVRRGSDKTIHQITIITVVIFAGSIILGIVA